MHQAAIQTRQQQMRRPRPHPGSALLRQPRPLARACSCPLPPQAPQAQRQQTSLHSGMIPPQRQRQTAVREEGDEWGRGGSADATSSHWARRAAHCGRPPLSTHVLQVVHAALASSALGLLLGRCLPACEHRGGSLGCACNVAQQPGRLWVGWGGTGCGARYGRHHTQPPHPPESWHPCSPLTLLQLAQRLPWPPRLGWTHCGEGGRRMW